MKFLILFGLTLIALAFYIRKSPVKIPTLADIPVVDADTSLMGGFTAVRPFDGPRDEILVKFTQIALATPRTTQLSDDPLQFITRSQIVGFPDVTTIADADGVLTIHAHSVYGASDLGVNKARVLDWLERAGPLTRAD